NLNGPKFETLGPDTGFDAVHDLPLAEKLGGFMDLLEQKHALPKTIIYTLNPKDYYVIGTAMGSFQGGGIPGKIQFGAGWWFCDHKDGIVEQLRALANLSSLPRFVGMLTDSRSFLSYSRHEYFRRILCNLLGTWAEAGEIPADLNLLDTVVRDICFRNAQAYFA
ncbi:MAG: glucuronate isomerase, partial [Sphaerochaetaceae bacterium]|nr:glucuronate isomerase [Sphaerochaetaceae bacterium]